MARIRKYKQGGSSSKNYGILTIDNREYKVDDNLINDLYNYSKTLDPDVSYQFNNIIESLNNGENINYNSSNNSITGNINFDVTNRQNSRLSRRRSKAGKLLGNIWDGKENNSRLAINALKNFTISPKDKINYDWSKELVGEYIIDGDKKKYVNGANNIAIINRLKSLPLISNYSNDDIFTGYNNLSKQDYINFYNNIGEEGLNNLINNIKNGTWDASDAEALNDIGIILSEPNKNNPNNIDKNNSNNTSNQNLINNNNNGNNNPLPQNSPYFTIDSNGRIFVTDTFNQTFGNKNSIYNDIWENSLMRSGQWDPEMSWLKGYTRLGNRLYKTSDFGVEGSDLYNYARTNGGFYDLNRTNHFNSANNIFEYLWGNKADFSSWDNKSVYNDWMSNRSKNFRYRPLNGLYEIPEGQQLIQYYENPELDYLGLPKSYKYALFDNKGNLINDNIDINDYNEILDGTQLPFSGLSLINDENSPYNGMYINKFNLNGDPNKIWLFVDSKDPNNMIYYSRDLWDKNNMMDKNIRIPKELAIAINNNPRFWDLLLSNATLQNRFNRTLQEGVSSQLGDALRTTIGKGLGVSNTLSKNDLLKLGFNDDVASKLYDYLQNDFGDRNGRSRWQRRLDWLVDRYDDGSIEYHQDGGIIGSTVDAKSKSKETKKDNYRDIKETAGTKNNWDLSTADKMQIASIAGDITSLLAAIPTGGNPVAAGIGAGSSLAQFVSDVQRDGLNGSDIFSLFTNLGLDAVTLLPGAGIAGKTAKLVKGIKKVANPLRKFFIGAGAFSAAKSLSNIISGDYNLNDLKNISNGFLVVKGLKDEIQNITLTKYNKGISKSPIKTNNDLKKDFVDNYIKSNPNVTKYNNSDVEWYNSKENKVIDYDKAIEGLKSSGVKIPDFKIRTQAILEKGKSKIKDAFKGKYNPFSSNFKYSMKNRTIRDDLDFNNLTNSQLRALTRIKSFNPNINLDLYNNSVLLPSRVRFDKFPFILPSNFNMRGPWYYNAPEYTVISHKKGGKIIKGQNGINDINLLEKNKDGTLGTVNANDIIISSNGYKKPEINLSNNNIKRDFNLENIIDNVGTKASKDLYKDNQSLNNINITNNNKFGTENIKIGNINKDAVLGLTDFIISNSTINSANKDLKNSIKEGIIGSQLQYSKENYPSLYLGDINRGISDRIKNLLLYKTINSDPKIQMAQRLAQNAQIDQINREGNAAISSRITDFNNKMLETRQRYSDIRNDISNRNRNNLSKGLAQLHLAESSRKQQRAQNIKNLIYQFRQDYASDLNEAKQASNIANQLRANNDFSTELYSLYQDKYNNLTNEEKSRYPTIEQYVQSVDPKGYSELINKYYANLPIDEYNKSISHSWFGRPKLDRYNTNYNFKNNSIITKFVKNGGKLYRYREVGEQHYLDQQKAITKAINDLNNNIIKLFMQMMS